MVGYTQDRRTAVMIVALASWQDPSGMLQTVPARIEDRSLRGACLRLKRPVIVGSKLKVETHREHFFGVSKYCRTEGLDFLVGIQRDKTITSVMSLPELPLGEQASAEDTHQAPLPTKIEDPTGQATPAPSAATFSPATKGSDKPVAPQEKDITVEVPQLTREPARPHVEARKARKTMRNKLLEFAHWHSKSAAVSENGNYHIDTNANQSSSVAEGVIIEPHSAPAGAHVKIELLPADEIYREAGITSVRNGASITRVIEMLHSEHIRSLSSEMKRAAILMALDSAGISLPQVLQDALARQKALDGYEADQKRMVEAAWARKTGENTQIEAELERVKAHCVARIARNLESIEREKATFAAWLEKKQEESQNIGEASALLNKPEVAAPVPTPPVEAEQAKAASAS